MTADEEGTEMTKLMKMAKTAEFNGRRLAVDADVAAGLLRAIADIVEAAGDAARDEEFWRKVALETPPAGEEGEG